MLLREILAIAQMMDEESSRRRPKAASDLLDKVMHKLDFANAFNTRACPPAPNIINSVGNLNFEDEIFERL